MHTIHFYPPHSLHHITATTSSPSRIGAQVQSAAHKKAEGTLGPGMDPFPPGIHIVAIGTELEAATITPRSLTVNPSPTAAQIQCPGEQALLVDNR